MSNSNQNHVRQARPEEITNLARFPPMGSPQKNSEQTQREVPEVKGTSSLKYINHPKYGKLESFERVNRELAKITAICSKGHWYEPHPSTIGRSLNMAFNDYLIDIFYLNGKAGTGKNSIYNNQKCINREDALEWLLLSGSFRLRTELTVPVNPPRSIPKKGPRSDKNIRRGQRDFIGRRRYLSWYNRLGLWLYELGKVRKNVR
tara:strand:+ start:1360 stop:1971 length:612 start_codon:yes stop_codon:yes gene_type:complete